MTKKAKKRILDTFVTTTVGLVLLAAGPGSAPAAAQVAWESPFLAVPGQTGGIGIYLLEPDPGDELGAVVTWESGHSSEAFDLGFRAGIAEGYDDDVAVSGGIDASGSLLQASDDVPVDLIWGLGAGLSVGDHVMVGFPATLVAGRTFSAEGLRITPFAGPRLSLDAHFGRDRPRARPDGTRSSGDDDDADLNLSADLGFDLALSSAWAIRFAASVGDRDALAVGVRLVR